MKLRQTSEARGGRVYTSLRLKAENRRAAERLLAEDPHFETLTEAIEWLIEEGRRATGDQGAVPDAEARGYAAGLRRGERAAREAIVRALANL